MMTLGQFPLAVLLTAELVIVGIGRLGSPFPFTEERRK